MEDPNTSFLNDLFAETPLLPTTSLSSRATSSQTLLSTFRRTSSNLAHGEFAWLQTENNNVYSPLPWKIQMEKFQTCQMAGLAEQKT